MIKSRYSTCDTRFSEAGEEGQTILEESLVKSSGSNGIIEGGFKMWKAK